MFFVHVCKILDHISNYIKTIVNHLKKQMFKYQILL